jgi:hypothetical protein
MTGGKREGAGRPPSPNPANVNVHIKMTAQQHRQFLDLGGSRWVKRLIDLSIKVPPKSAVLQKKE